VAAKILFLVSLVLAAPIIRDVEVEVTRIRGWIVPVAPEPTTQLPGTKRPVPVLDLLSVQLLFHRM
jgi:hypothetical protein